jgi:hypothetical protein
MPLFPVDPEAAVAHGLFSTRQARDAGYTPAGIALRVRRGEWVRSGRRLLRTAGRTDEPGDVLLVAVLRAGPSAVVSHTGAAAALGWDLLEAPSRVDLIVPRTHGAVRLANVRIHRVDLRRDEVTAVGVLPVTSPLRTALDVAATMPEIDAIVALDSALRLRQLSRAELRAEYRTRTRLRGRPRAAQVLELLDPTSGSAPETVARLLFRDCGPMPCTQFTVTAGGRFVARVDFAWPELRLVVEIDGFAWHSSRSAFQRDHDRQHDLEEAGWAVLRFTADDVLHRPDEVAATVRRRIGKLLFSN